MGEWAAAVLDHLYDGLEVMLSNGEAETPGGAQLRWLSSARRGIPLDHAPSFQPRPACNIDAPSHTLNTALCEGPLTRCVD